MIVLFIIFIIILYLVFIISDGNHITKSNMNVEERKNFLIGVYDKWGLEFSPKMWAKYRDAWYTDIHLANSMENTYPILNYISTNVNRAYNEIQTDKIPSDQVKIWYLYNMGYVVKTQDVCFGIDIITRDADIELVNTLDFAIVSHKHEDHFQLQFVDAMRRAGKQVYAPFYFQSMSAFNTRKNIKLYTKNSIVDLDFTMSAQIAEQNLLSQITINDSFTILHIGDNTHIDFINPTRHVNVFMLDARLQPPLHRSKNNKTQPIDSHYAPKDLLTTLDAIKRVNASYSLLGHIMELGHSNIIKHLTVYGDFKYIIHYMI